MVGQIAVVGKFVLVKLPLLEMLNFTYIVSADNMLFLTLLQKQPYYN